MTKIKQWLVGQAPKFSAKFYNELGALADPTTITFRIGRYEGTTTSYVYGVDLELIKDAVGEYHIVVEILQAFVPSAVARWEAAGAIIDAYEDRMSIEASKLA